MKTKELARKPQNPSQSSGFWGPEKNIFSRTWNFLWKDESIWSWLISLVLAFIIVKFIFFPALSLILSTPLPLVVVESESMHHPGSFLGNVIGLEDNFQLWWSEKGEWYESEGLKKEEVKFWPLKTGLEMGDIVVVSGYGSVKVGDVIIFEAGQKHPIIHRVVNIKEGNNEMYYETKGDNNSGQLSVEKNISNTKVIGKALFRIPKLGWIKLAFVKILQGFS